MRLSIGFGIVGCLVAGGAMAATAKLPLEVLGIHHGDAMEEANAALASKGFGADPSFRYMKDDCSKSYADLVRLASSSGISDINLIRCETDWVDKAGRKVHLVSVATPAGYRVSRVRYQMPVPGGASAVSPELAKKFGPAPLVASRMGGKYQSFTGAEPGIVITLSDESMADNSAIMLLAPRSEFADDEKAMTAIRQAGAQKRTGGALKL